jgi:prepilin-type N-terminal cleavage/methylation domain-containing protein
MSLNNINKERGFTIVELLIVIVVIGILAAITIVAYNGVQSRARATTNQATAQEVQSKSEVYAADAGNGLFPSSGTTFETFTDTSALSPATKTALSPTAPSATNASGVNYAPCPATNPTGAKIGYWDPSLSTPAVVYLYSGNATSASTCGTPA